MRGKQYLTKPEQFTAVYDKGNSWVNSKIVLKAIPNDLEISRYGFSISSRVGGAVIRNRTKRRLREIVRQIRIKSGWDIVLIARPAAADVKYSDLEDSVTDLFNRAKLITKTETREIPELK